MDLPLAPPHPQPQAHSADAAWTELAMAIAAATPPANPTAYQTPRKTGFPKTHGHVTF